MSVNLYSAAKYEPPNAVGETDFTIPFPYLRERDVYVYYTLEPVNENDDPVVQLFTRGVDWEFADAQTVRLTNPVESGYSVTVRRFTKKETRLADYFDGSYLTEKELNDVTKQLLYLIQEIDDYKRIGEGTLFVPGEEDDGSTGDTVQDVLDQLYNSAIWQTLTGLIDLVDINAEAIIRDALTQHENWQMDLTREELLGARLDQQGADIIRVEETVETANSSMAETIELLDARVDDNEAFALEFKQVYADENSSIGKLVTQLSTKLEAGDLNGEGSVLAQSDVIDAVYSETNRIDGRVTTEAGRITSLLSRVNTHIVDENGNIVPNSILSTVSQQASTAASDSSTNAQVLTQLGSAVGYSEDPWVPADFAAAIQQKWETYADSESAAAQAVSELQASTQPIFFGEDIPVAYTTSTAGYELKPGFESSGFPDGCVWHRRFIYQGKWTTLSYTFYRGRNSFSGLEGIDPSSPAPYAFFINGIDGTQSGPGHGMWISESVSAVGALLREEGGAEITADSASAMFSQLAQVAVDDRFGAIEQTMEAYLGENENDPGYIDLQWAVRMNTSVGGMPTIAGFGLGLEGNSQSATSNFAVIADYFTVSAPPDFGSLENGNLDPNSFITPFIVDAASGNVIVNGDLFVSDNFHAYEGRLKKVHAGNIVVGQMDPSNDIDPNWEGLLDTSGFRLELLSSTNNYWADVDPGVDRNYLLWAGSGSLTQNNGVFWVDSEGNAFFGGLVQAANVAGQMTNAFYHKHSEDPWLDAGTNWTDVGSPVEFTLTTNRSLSALVAVNFAMVHGRAGQVRVRVGINNGFGGYNWYDGPSDSWTMDRNDGQQNVTTLFCPPDHTYAGTADAGPHIRIQPQIRDAYGWAHSCAGYRAEVKALPGTVSYSEGNGTPGSSSGGGSGDGGGNDDGGIPPGPDPGFDDPY